MIAQLDDKYLKLGFWRIYRRLISYLLFEGRPATTKGKFINPLVFFLFSIFKRLPLIKNTPAPIFIIGTGRSGTTILGKILSVHKDVGYLNEPKALWYSVIREDDLIGSYTKKQGKYFIKPDEICQRQVRHLHKLYFYYRLLTATSRVVDKYPEMVFRYDMVKKIFPEAKFIFLIRNGNDTISSISKWNEKNEVSNSNELENWWGVDNKKWNLLKEQILLKSNNLDDLIKRLDLDTIGDFDKGALEWIVTMEKGIELSKKYSKDVLQIKYEDLVERSEEVLKGICEFCQLSYDDLMMKYAQDVLIPNSRKKQPDLIPAILESFVNTQQQLGYS